MIDREDFITKKGRSRKFYKATCDKCGADRGYKRPNHAYSLCKACSGSINASKNSIKYSNVDYNSCIKATRIVKGDIKTHKRYKINCLECNKSKGLARLSNALKPCLSCAAKIRHANMSEEIKEAMKIKISCTQRNMDTNDFKDFSTTRRGMERREFRALGLSKQCLKKADYICDITGIRGHQLVAHHMNSWDSFPEQRFDPDNLVCMSKNLHVEFHKKYGFGNNTREQYEEFKAEFSQ